MPQNQTQLQKMIEHLPENPQVAQDATDNPQEFLDMYKLASIHHVIDELLSSLPYDLISDHLDERPAPEEEQKLFQTKATTLANINHRNFHIIIKKDPKKPSTPRGHRPARKPAPPARTTDNRPQQPARPRATFRGAMARAMPTRGQRGQARQAQRLNPEHRARLERRLAGLQKHGSRFSDKIAIIKKKLA